MAEVLDVVGRLRGLWHPNTGLGHNSMVYMTESQLEAEMAGTVWTAGHCASWYLDDTGRNTTLWPSFSYKFRRATRTFDETPYEMAT